MAQQELVPNPKGVVVLSTSIIMLFVAVALVGVISYPAALLAADVLWWTRSGVLLTREESFGPRRQGRTQLTVIPSPDFSLQLPIFEVKHLRWKINGGSIYNPSTSTGALLSFREFFRALILYPSPGRM